MDRLSHRDYEGAYVFPPTPGVFKWVLGLDFASLYPTTQRQFNISPDTYLFTDKNYTPKENEIKTASGAVFTKEFEGFLPKILTDFYAQRKMHKKYMKNAYQKATELEMVLEERLKNEK
jgi:DNA polymerase elongation subunit (family B)